MKAAKSKSRRATPKAVKVSKSGKRGLPPSLLRRIEQLEETVDSLRGRLIHNDKSGRIPESELLALPVAQDRFIRATADGWLLVLVAGTRTSLPSGLKISLTSSSGGRDYGTVLEGVLAGTAFDVSSGNLQTNFRRLENLQANVKTRAGGPVVIGGTSYELELRIAFSEGGNQRTIGPFAAKTDSTNPVPLGNHDLEIADYPHDGGAQYGPHGMVWFRIGHQGDRYVHPGRISAGCLTCAPSQWEEIYPVLNCARANDRVSIGKMLVQ